MENLIEKQLLDVAEKLTELVAENKEAATESEVESEVQIKLEPLEEIEVHSVQEEEAKLQLDDEAGKLNVEILIENKEIKTETETENGEESFESADEAGQLNVKILIEIKEIKTETETENEEESFESADEASTFLTPTSSRSRSRSRSRSSTPESSPMRPIITSPVPRRQPPPKVEELSETSESSMENEQEEEEGDETFVKKEPDVDDSENKLVIDENNETESKPDSNKKVEAKKMADAAGEIQETANEIHGNAEQLEKVEKVAVANEESESNVEEQLSMKRKMYDNQSDGFEKKKKVPESKELKNVLK